MRARQLRPLKSTKNHTRSQLAETKGKQKERGGEENGREHGINFPRCDDRAVARIAVRAYPLSSCVKLQLPRRIRPAYPDEILISRFRSTDWRRPDPSIRAKSGLSLADRGFLPRRVQRGRFLPRGRIDATLCCPARQRDGIVTCCLSCFADR